MDVTIGKRRSVVQNKRRFTCGTLLDFFVQFKTIPVSDSHGLALSQTCPHREVGYRQIQGILELYGHN